MIVWDVAAKKLLSQRKAKRHPPYYPTMADGRRFFEEGVEAGTSGRVLQLTDLTDDRVLRTWKCYDWRATAMALSPNESLLAVATPEGPVVLVVLRAEKK